MGLDAATIHVSRDQNHLAWDPAIPPVASVGSGDVVEFDCLDASDRPAARRRRRPTTLADARLRPRRPGHRAGRRRRRRAGRHAPGRPARVRRPRDWGWTASIPGLRPAGRRLPRSLLQGDAPRGRCWSRRVLAGHPDPGGAVLRRDRRGAPPRDRYSTIPPDVHGGNMDTRHLVADSDAVPAGLQSGGPTVPRRGRPCDPGRRRGVRVPPSKRRCGLACASPLRKDLHLDAPAFLAAPDPHAELRNGARYADRRHRAGPARSRPVTRCGG